MVIFLRQSNVDPSASGVNLSDCCYIRVRRIEIFPDYVDFFPRRGVDCDQILKTKDDNWIEPLSQIEYEYLIIYKKLPDFLPSHIEIYYPRSNNFADRTDPPQIT